MTSPQDEPAGGGPQDLSVLEPLLGVWTGVSKGSFGTANLERVSEYILQGRFVRVNTRSVAEKDPHEDIALFSYDEARSTIVLREFHAEGYVIRYRLVSAADGVLTFESEDIENPIDPTLRARTVIHVTNPLVETLELATDQGPFVLCVEARFEPAAGAS